MKKKAKCISIIHPKHLELKDKQMKSVKIEKSKLLEILKENKTKHLKDYKTASKVFLEDAIAKLQEMLDIAKKDGKVIRDLGLDQPVSYVDSYDTVIQMLELSVEDIVELSFNEFQQYVEDKWHWKQSFLSLTSAYIK